MNRAALPGSAKCLAGGAADDQVNVARLHAKRGQNLGRRKLADVALENRKLTRLGSAVIAIEAKRLTKRRYFLDTGPNCEATSLLKANV